MFRHVFRFYVDDFLDDIQNPGGRIGDGRSRAKDGATTVFVQKVVILGRNDAPGYHDHVRTTHSLVKDGREDANDLFGGKKSASQWASPSE